MCSSDLSQYENEKIVEKKVCEIYFESNFIDSSEEQFILSIERTEKNNLFQLKRINHKSIFGCESKVRLTKKEFYSLLKGSFEWMKSSSKLLVNEFYQKMNLYEYQVGKMITFIRKQIERETDGLLVMIDTAVQPLLQVKNFGIVSQRQEQNLAYVTIRKK